MNEKLAALIEQAKPRAKAAIGWTKWWFSSIRRLWATAFAAVFLFSLLAWAMHPGKTRSVVLFFPTISADLVKAETRIIPYRFAQEDAIELLIREIALGPATVSYSPVVSNGTKVESVMVRSGVVYADFNEIASLNEGCTGKITDAADIIRKTVVFNHPEVKRVVVSIGGHELEPGTAR